MLTKTMIIYSGRMEKNYDQSSWFIRSMRIRWLGGIDLMGTEEKYKLKSTYNDSFKFLKIHLIASNKYIEFLFLFLSNIDFAWDKWSDKSRNDRKSERKIVEERIQEIDMVQPYNFIWSTSSTTEKKFIYFN
jgi:hypothetical protein